MYKNDKSFRHFGTANGGDWTEPVLVMRNNKT